MNCFLRYGLFLGALAFSSIFPTLGYAKENRAAQPTPVAHKSKHHSKHHESSSSSSSDCRSSDLPDAEKIRAPKYISSKDGKPVMQIAVLNRTHLISSKLLDKVLDVVTKQVNEDFAPFYGIYVKFKVFKDQYTVDWTRYVPLVIDDLLPFDCGCIAFHGFEDTPSNGEPNADVIFNPLPLPVGTPYLVVPMGTPTTDYGVVPASLSGDPTLPPTFEGIFSEAVSHETLETLHNYTTNGAVLNFIGNIELVDAYIPEVCDPVEFTPGYLLCGLNVANFVLPSYWVNDYQTGPFDFLDTVPAPFTPYQGEQEYAEFGPCGGELFALVSPPISQGNPSEPVLEDLGPIFAPCTCGATNVKALKPKGKPGAAKKSCCGSGPSGLHVYKRAGQAMKAQAKKAA